jgi:LysM repeat protein
VERGWRREAKRYGAPAAFLLAVTIAVLLVRSGLQSDAAPTTTTATVRTQTVSTRTTTTPVPVKRRRFYRLRAGETLSDVAIKYNTTVEQLLALNPGIEPTNLTVGQRVRVK